MAKVLKIYHLVEKPAPHGTGAPPLGKETWSLGEQAPRIGAPEE